jgi:hypothetical protein
MAQPCQNRCRQIQATKTASIGLAYDFLRFLRLPQTPQPEKTTERTLTNDKTPKTPNPPAKGYDRERGFDR